MNEIAYPVWSVSAKWNEPNYKNNGCGFDVSTKGEVYDISKWWKKYVKKKLSGRDYELLELKLEFIGNQVWYRGWFCHESLNYFDNEEEAFKSFEEYLKQFKFHDNSLGKTYKILDKDYKEVCLMGAEDRWRWKFCGCKVCKKKQITVIKH